MGDLMRKRDETKEEREKKRKEVADAKKPNVKGRAGKPQGKQAAKADLKARLRELRNKQKKDKENAEKKKAAAAAGKSAPKKGGDKKADKKGGEKKKRPR